MTDQSIIDSQKGVVKEIMVDILKNWSFKEGFVGFSLPAKIFSSKTQINLVTEAFSTFEYIYAAHNSVDPLETDPTIMRNQKIERLKNIMMFAAASMFNLVQTKKPFNPYIGETFQGFYSDGTKIFIEHIQHNPPVDSFYIINEKLDVKLYGSIIFLGNAMLIKDIEEF